MVVGNISAPYNHMPMKDELIANLPTSQMVVCSQISDVPDADNIINLNFVKEGNVCFNKIIYDFVYKHFIDNF
jgi:hypothetical protein